MYTKQSAKPTTLRVNKTYEGETMEEKVRRLMNNKEPIKDGAPVIYTERKQGILPEHDIRTDRWDIAIDGMSHVERSNTAKREMRIGEQTFDTMTKEQQAAFNKKFPGNKHDKPTGGGEGKA